MSPTELGAFALIAALLTVTPGPNGVLIARTVPISGPVAGFGNVAGFAIAFYVHGALSFFGLSIILVQSAQAFFVVKMLGAGYLCWIGIKALLAAVKGAPPRAVTTPAGRRRFTPSFVEGFLTNALNPKVSMFYLAAFPQFIAYDASGQAVIGPSFLLVSIHVLIVATWFTAFILLFSRLQAVAQGSTFQRWLNAVTGVVFIGFGVRLAMTRMP